MESFVKVYVFLDFVKWSFYRFGYIKMPSIVMDEIHEKGVVNELNGNSTPTKENLVENKSPKKTSPQSPGIAAADFLANEVVDTSIEQLYENSDFNISMVRFDYRLLQKPGKLFGMKQTREQCTSCLAYQRRSMERGFNHQWSSLGAGC